MKKLIIALSLLVQPAFGEALPEYMKDGEITVKLKDGKTYTFSANQMKVVPRKEKKKAVSAPEQTITKQTEEKAKYDKNSLLLHAGLGRMGLQSKYNNGQHQISERDQVPVGGATYCRNMGSGGLCASGFTNSTFTLGIKVDY